jgi:hypothetical protein
MDHLAASNAQDDEAQAVGIQSLPPDHFLFQLISALQQGPLPPQIITQVDNNNNNTHIIIKIDNGRVNVNNDNTTCPVNTGPVHDHSTTYNDPVNNDHSDRSSVVNNDHSTSYNASAGSNPDAMAELEARLEKLHQEVKVLNVRWDEWIEQVKNPT